MPQKDHEIERLALAKAIGGRIKSRIKERHMVGSYICRKMSISATSLTNWTSGKNIPDTYYLLELAGILEVEVYYLITGQKIGTKAENSEQLKKLDKECYDLRIENKLLKELLRDNKKG
jgi:transcriptional regulator with XRE-family HTH domain